MKLLYIGNKLIKASSGADQVNQRNQRLLEKIFDGRITYIPVENNSFIHSFSFGISNSVIAHISKELYDGSYKYVFVSHSLYGKAVHYIKHNFPEIIIVVFFHNIEICYAESYLKTAGIKAIKFYLSAKKNEKECCNFSDVCLTLNDRDSNNLFDRYGVNSAATIPTSFVDCFDETMMLSSQDENLNIDYLFVGVAFFANIRGIQWFIDNVMPYVPGHLYVVGNGMTHSLFHNLTSRTHILGCVEDLSKYYYNAKSVVIPIFAGSGMKTKTIEALMYGKTLYGTTEAFQGCTQDASCMKLCNTAEEYINQLNINTLSKKINMSARKVFLSEFNDNVSLERMRSIFK